MYLEVVRSVFMSSTSASGTGRKRTIKDLQEEVSNLYNNIRLFEKGMKYFAGIFKCLFFTEPCNSARKAVVIKCPSFPDDTQTALTKHLLKTVCTDITNLMFNFLASDFLMAVEEPAAITSDVC